MVSDKNIDVPAGTRLVIDWFSMTTRKHSVADVIDLLGMRGCNFEESRGNQGFAHRLGFAGVYIHFNRNEYEGKNTGSFVWLEMTGQGCRTFETYGTGDFEGLLMLVNNEYGKEKADKDVRLTRIDIAFDDMDNVLDINRIFIDTMNENFVSRMSKFSYIGGSDGKSVTFGSQSSNVLVRIYDKATERGYSPEDVPHWVRCELKLKNDNAVGFAWNLQFDGIQQLYFSTLKQYLSFRVPSDTDSNKRRWKETEYWSRFLAEAVSKSLLEKPGVIYNLSKCEKYVMTQPIGSIKTLVKIYGIDTFIRMIYEAPMPKNPKYQKLIAEHTSKGMGSDVNELVELLEHDYDNAQYLKQLREELDEIHRNALDKARAYRKKERERETLRFMEKMYQDLRRDNPHLYPEKKHQ